MRVILSLLLLVSSFGFSQSPWTQKKGEAFTQISFSSISSYETLFGNPDYAAERAISDRTIQLYAEYGLNDKTSLVFNLPIKSLKAGDLVIEGSSSFTEKGTKTTLGNIDLGIKHNFIQNKWLVTGQLNIESNTGSYDKKTGLRSGIDAFTLTPLITIGKGQSKLYYQGFLGTHLRTNDYSSAFKVGGEIGFKLFNKLWLVAFLDIVKSFENGDIDLPQENRLTGLYVNNQEYGGFGLKAIGEFTDQFGATASFGGAFFGNNVAKQAAFSFGLYQKF
jgi:hypothetical protein